MFRTTKKYFVIFYLFFYDVVVFAANFGGFQKNKNIAILKQRYILLNHLVISWPIWLKFHRLISDMILHR